LRFLIDDWQAFPNPNLQSEINNPMPRTFTRPFRIRYYECDPYGHVNNANYLRYATQAALEASADAGYDSTKYAELGTLWLIREAGIEYLRPARFGDTLNVKTWVADFRRVRSRREYEMTLEGGSEIVSRAYTDWVYLDAQTLQPARIPDEMRAAFFPEGLPPEAPKREPLAEPPPPPPGAFTTRRRVAWHHLDTAGHMNSAWYLSMLEDVAIDAAASAGWTMQRSQEAGIAILAREHRIEYLKPALLGDELLCTTYVGEFRRVSATRYCLFHRASDGEPLARAWTLWVWVDPATGRPRPIPAEAPKDFAAQLVQE
jgi:acyl-CoA thioester hydrolase